VMSSKQQRPLPTPPPLNNPAGATAAAALLLTSLTTPCLPPPCPSSAITNKILEFSKITSEEESAGLTLHNEPFCLGSVAASAAEILGGQALIGGVDLIVDLDYALHFLPLLGDAFRLRQCVLNLAGARPSLPPPPPRSTEKMMLSLFYG